MDYLKRSIKDFHRVSRLPSMELPGESLNVYNQSRSFGRMPFVSTKPNLNEKLQQLKVTSKPAIKVSSIKSIKLKRPVENCTEKLLKIPENSVFNKKKIEMGALTELSQKESIIYNQVKLFKTKSKLEEIQNVESDPQLWNTKMKTNNFKKFSTIKKAMLDRDKSVDKDFIEDVVDSNTKKSVSLPKRKQLKKKTWKWVGAEGTIIY